MLLNAPLSFFTLQRTNLLYLFYTNLQIWHTMNKIRLLTKGELPKAIELSWQVFTITSKEDFNDEGLEFFKSFIYNEKYIDEITFYGSFNNKVLTGILGIKNNGKHISLFLSSLNITGKD